jgi:malonate transporter and related proteins
MQHILAVTVPFFALVLCGYLAARQRVLPEAAIPGLNAFVLYFALPCMLFRFGIGTPLAELLNPAVVLVYLCSALLILWFTIAITWGRRVNLKDAAFGALVAAFPNSGFMGVPLLVALLGSAAAGPVICTMLIDMFVTSSICIALAQGYNAHRAGRDGAAGKASNFKIALAALRGPLANPLPWAILAGAACGLAGVKPPAPMQSVIDLLGSAATPVALFTIGAVLWRAGAHAQGPTPLAHYALPAAVKLLLHPLLVLALGLGAMALGLPLSNFQLTVLVLCAALPSASNVSLLAERFAADNGRVARIILSSTVLAFLSFSALAWVFGVRG